MQKQTHFHARNSFVPVLVAIVMLFYICGCTNLALNIAETKAEIAETEIEDTIDYMLIKNIRNATKHENGDISICVDLLNLAEINKEPECHTIVLPISSLAKGPIEKNVYGFKSYSVPANIHPVCKFYWYPITKAQKGCENISSENSSSAQSSFPIEVFNVPMTHYYDSISFDTCSDLIKERSPEERILAVRWISSEQDILADSNTQESIEDKVSDASKMHLIYLPSQIKQEQGGINPIGIVGGYQVDEGNNAYYLNYLYYLSVPPAFIVDLFLIGCSTGLGGL
jgi:hypothetical protein